MVRVEVSLFILLLTLLAVTTAKASVGISEQEARVVFSELRVANQDISSDHVLQLRGYTDDSEGGSSGSDISFHHDHENKETVLVAPSTLVPHITSVLPNARVIHSDLAKYYEDRNKDDLLQSGDTDELNSGSQGGAFNINELVAFLLKQHETYPDIVSKPLKIGCSLQGRPIFTVVVGSSFSNDIIGLEEAFPGATSNDTNEVDLAGKCNGVMQISGVPSSPNPRIVYTGMHHSREPASMQSLLYYIRKLSHEYTLAKTGSDVSISDTSSWVSHYLVRQRELWLVPLVNPDGFAENIRAHPRGGGMQRKNMRDVGCPRKQGVDLNRNYGYLWGYNDAGSSGNPCYEDYRGTKAFSEPETKSLSSFVKALNPGFIMNLHTYGGELLYPYGYEKGKWPDTDDDKDMFQSYAWEMTKSNKYLTGTGWSVGAALYVTNGESDDYYYGSLHIKAMTSELGSMNDGFWPVRARYPAIANDALPMFYHLASAVGVMMNDTSVTWDINSRPLTQGLTLTVHSTNVGLSEARVRIRVSIFHRYDDSNFVFDVDPVPARSKMTQTVFVPLLSVQDHPTPCWSWGAALVSIEEKYHDENLVEKSHLHDTSTLTADVVYQGTPYHDIHECIPESSPGPGSPAPSTSPSPTPVPTASPATSSPHPSAPVARPSPMASPIASSSGSSSGSSSSSDGVIQSPGFALTPPTSNGNPVPAPQPAASTIVAITLAVVAVIVATFFGVYHTIKFIRGRRLRQFSSVDPEDPHNSMVSTAATASGDQLPAVLPLSPGLGGGRGAGQAIELPSLRPAQEGDIEVMIDEDDILTGDEDM